MQEFVFNCAIPTRVGFQNPFTNVTLDIKPSPSLGQAAGDYRRQAAERNLRRISGGNEYF